MSAEILFRSAIKMLLATLGSSCRTLGLQAQAISRACSMLHEIPAPLLPAIALFSDVHFERASYIHPERVQ